MDAVEELPRLVDAFGACRAATCSKRVLAGAVDPREPQDRDRLLGARCRARSRPARRRAARGCAPTPARAASSRRPTRRRDRHRRRRSRDRRSLRRCGAAAIVSAKCASTGSPSRAGGTETSSAVGIHQRGGRPPASPSLPSNTKASTACPPMPAPRWRRPSRACAPCRRCGQNRAPIFGDVMRAPNSRGRSRTELAIRLRAPLVAAPRASALASRRCVRRQAARSRARIEPRQRPHGRAAHQRRGIVEQPLGLRGERGIARIADRDQHIAHEAVAPDALDRRFGKQRAERRIVEPRQFGERRRAQRRRARRASPRGRPARTCSTGRPRGSRRSRRCGCPSRRAARAGSGPCARWSGTRCSAAHRAGRAPETPSVGQTSRQARHEPQ